MTLRQWLAIPAALGLSIIALSPSASAAPMDEMQPGGGTKSLYMLLIQQARSDGRPRAALAYLDDFERQYPGELDAQILRVNCLLDLGQADLAAAQLARLPANDRTGKSSTVRGHVYVAQQNWAAAIEQYEAALRASPADPLTLNALGFAQLQAGATEAALGSLASAADLSPRNEVIRNNLLLALTMAGRIEAAEARLRSIKDPLAQAQLRREIADQSARLSAPVGGNAKGEE